MTKDSRIIARVTDEERRAIRQLSGPERKQSVVIRELIREGLQRRGLWPPPVQRQHSQEART